MTTTDPGGADTGHHLHETAIALPDHGHAALTRVRDEHGREYGEIRARIALDADEYTARVQVTTALTDLHTLLSHAAQLSRRTA